MIMKIEEKSCQNEGAFKKKIIFKGFQPIVIQLVFLILFQSLLFFYHYSFSVSTKVHKSMYGLFILSKRISVWQKFEKETLTLSFLSKSINSVLK